MYKQIVFNSPSYGITLLIDIHLCEGGRPIDNKFFNYYLSSPEDPILKTKKSGTIQWDVCTGELELLRIILEDLKEDKLEKRGRIK